MQFSSEKIRITAVLIIGSILLLALHAYANWNGLGLTDDSYAYVSQAHFFQETGTFRKGEIHPLFPFQAFLIVVLAVFTDSKAGVNYMNVVNAILLTGNFILLMIVASKVFSNFVYVLIFALVIITSTPLLLVHSFLWTEPFFILSITLLMLLLIEHIRRPSILTYAAFVFLFLLLFIQRKAGLLFFTGTGLGFILFLNSWPRVWKILIIAGCLLLIIIFYRFDLIGEAPRVSNFWESTVAYVDFLSAWLLPLNFPIWIRVVVFVGLLSFVGVSIFRGDYEEKISKFLKILFTVFVSYCIIRLFFFRPDPSEIDRYLAPVFPIFFILLLASIDSVLRNASLRIRQVTIALIVLWLLYPALRTVKNATLWHTRPTVTELSRNSNG
jgi:hypothetical protein